MISNNILKFVEENKDKIFILKEFNYEGHIIGFKNNLIIIEWDLKKDSFTEEFFIEKLKEYTIIKEPIKIGDIVKITDFGAAYSFYTDWFIDHDIPYEYALRYGYGESPATGDLDCCFKVIAIHDRYLSFKGEKLYLIQRTDETIVYLMGENGIKKVGDDLF